MSYRLVFGVAEVFDRAFGAFGPHRRAFGAAMMNEKVREHDSFFRRKELHQILLDLIRPLLPGEIQAA